MLLGPTHEEEITQLVAAEVTSYRQLPLLLYQTSMAALDPRDPGPRPPGSLADPDPVFMAPCACPAPFPPRSRPVPAPFPPRSRPHRWQPASFGTRSDRALGSSAAASLS